MPTTTNKESVAPRTQTQKPKKNAAAIASKTGRFHDDAKSSLAVTVGVPPDTAYAFFRDFENLPLFMKDLKSIEVLSEKRSRWTVDVKGHAAQWEAEITSERAGEMIAWKSVEGSDVETSGTIWFSPAPETLGTVIGLSMDYKVPGGKLTELFTLISGEDPNSLALINLRRLKCYLETGEIATIEGQSSGREADAETFTKH